MNVKLLTKHHLEFLILKGGCTGSYESTLVKMPHCWKSHVTAHMVTCRLSSCNPECTSTSADNTRKRFRQEKKIYSSVGPFVQWSQTICAHLVVLRHHEEQFCELFFFNLDQWFRRSCLKIFLI